jgi:cardiolipin synthase
MRHRMLTNQTARFRWLRTGDEAFAEMLAAIHAAHTAVRLEMYIYTASPLGEEFREALVGAQRRGARVRVLIDALGSLNLRESFWDPLLAAGGEFRWFNPLRLQRLSYRDHRKILVCDNTVGFIGGLNSAPEYQGDGVTKGWRDMGVSITGRLLEELALSFDAQFALADFKHGRLTRLRRPAYGKRLATPEGELFLSSPGLGPSPIKRALAQDLANAKTVKIISAYFLPTWRIRRELMRTARQGNSVQLILAGKSDVPLSQLASQRLYWHLLRSRIEIYEYQPQILHAKLFIIDRIIYVGSANLDPRSLSINYELLVRVPNEKLANEASAIFAQDLIHCRKIDPATWRNSRTIWRKLKEDWAYFIIARVDPYWARRQLRTLR